MIKKIGSWVGAFKNYFNQVQNDISDIENSVEEEISLKSEIPSKVDTNNDK